MRWLERGRDCRICLDRSRQLDDVSTQPQTSHGPQVQLCCQSGELQLRQHSVRSILFLHLRKIPSHIFIPLKPNMPTFFALFLTSHYCNQINFPLRFHISHARPQAAALKRFASLRDVPEYSTRISDDDVVSNGNAHDTNIFDFTDTSPPHVQIKNRIGRNHGIQWHSFSITTTTLIRKSS